MFFSKKFILIVSLLSIISSIKPAQECKESLAVSFDEDEHKESIQNKLITLLSLENEKYQIPEKVALQSKFIQAAYDGNEDQEIPTCIKSENLEILLKILKIYNQHKNNKTLTKDLYEEIQHRVFLWNGFDSNDNNDLNTLASLSFDALKLDSDVLINIIADFWGQLIKQDSKNIDCAVEYLEIGQLVLINKYHFLRFKDEYYYQVIEFGNEEFNELIDQKMNISIQDVMGFLPIEVKNVRGSENYYLNLDDLKITDLNGFEQIKDIEKVMHLSLKNNRIKCLDNYLNNLLNLKYLDLENNKIEVIEKDNFIGLYNLKGLSLGRNKIKDLNNSFYNLNKLIGVNMSHNLLTTLKNNCGEFYLADFSNNLFKSIELDDFKGFVNLTALDFSKNKIIYFDQKLLDKFIIDFDNNPLNRCCQLKILTNYNEPRDYLQSYLNKKLKDKLDIVLQFMEEKEYFLAEQLIKIS